MKVLFSIVVVLALVSCVSAEQRKSLSDETETMLAQLEKEAMAQTRAAVATAHRRAGPELVERFTTSLAAQERDTFPDIDMAEAHKEAHKIHHHHSSPLFTEVASGVATETEVDANSGEAVKDVLKDLKAEEKTAKGAEKKMLDAQIRALEKATGAEVKSENKEGKQERKEEIAAEKKELNARLKAAQAVVTNKGTSSLSKLIASLDSLQNGGNNYASVHALILSSLQEVRIAWEQKRAEEVQRIQRKQEALEAKKQQLFADSCESGECPNDPPVPAVAPLSPFDCGQHASLICVNARSQCSQACGVSVSGCQDACNSAHQSCMQVQTASCGASFISTTEDAHEPLPLNVNDPSLVRPIEVPKLA